ncbi:hypothetical protein L209DRAFT_315483 [Thermothelomyces heterothallicus CBS 203.75]
MDGQSASSIVRCQRRIKGHTSQLATREMSHSGQNGFGTTRFTPASVLEVGSPNCTTDSVYVDVMRCAVYVRKVVSYSGTVESLQSKLAGRNKAKTAGETGRRKRRAGAGHGRRHCPRGASQPRHSTP